MTVHPDRNPIQNNKPESPMIALSAKDLLPVDGTSGTLVGRVFLPEAGGPAVSALCEMDEPARALREARGERIGDLADILANTPPDTRNTQKPWLLAPVDLQVLKAAGVTFAISMLERVIEERARGNPASA